ncbi:hypothetical protein FHETE_6549 [Fusarium heterosporum]|uniref:CFEM domain-containing protein n=1 Tax=Fusarium heterosporum TaxID=42747 RepID=A0A8H5T6U2_FUSHE|nr:hypothetical protein FHETE_6549 [Fusarium heterosporum]
MRKSTPYQLALLMASVATAADTSTCAIDCFQVLITNGPPAQCKEATNYLCFCTMPALQDNFMQCVDKTCSSEKDTATAWAGELCAKLGKPIDLGTPQDPPKTDATTAVDIPATSASDVVKPTTEAGKVTESKTTKEAAPTTTAAVETTEPKADKTPTTETSQVPSETTAVGTISNSTMTSISKPKDTTKSVASGDAAEATADKTTGDEPVVTLTGTADSATATASESSSAQNDSNAADSIVTPGLFTSVAIAVALWQLL